MPERRNADRLPALVLVVAALALLCWGLVRFSRFVHDDTFITLRYARHWIEGLGPVWNAGERVEGYTSFAMLALVSALGALGVDLLDAARAVNAAALVGLAAALALALRARSRALATPALPAAVCFALVMSYLPLAVWTWGGLEGPLFAFLTTAGVAATVVALDTPTRSRAIGAGALLALAVSTRPDGALFLVLCALALALRSREPDSDASALVGFCVPPVLLLGSQLLWRQLYYGTWVPNSVLAKATGLPPGAADRGLAYLADFAASPPFFLPLAALGLAVGLRRRRGRLGIALLAACIGGYALAIARVGGDHAPAHRLFLPLAPLSALLWFEGVAPVWDRLGRAVGWGAAATGALFAALQLVGLRPAFDAAALTGHVVGRYLQEQLPAGTVVALNTAGSVPYYAPDLVFIDMLGLNDAHIAARKVGKVRAPWQAVAGHAKGDGRYVLERAPDVIILGPAMGVTADRALFLSDVELAESEAFQRDYELHRERIDTRAYLPEALRSVERAPFLDFVYYRRR